MSDIGLFRANRYATIVTIQHRIGRNGDTQYANCLCYREHLYQLRTPALRCIRIIFTALAYYLRRLRRKKQLLYCGRLLYRAHRRFRRLSYENRRTNRVTWISLATFFTTDYIADSSTPNLENVDPLSLLNIIRNCRLFSAETVCEVARNVIKDRHRYYGHITLLRISNDNCDTACTKCKYLLSKLRDENFARVIIQSFDKFRRKSDNDTLEASFSR